MARNKPFNQLWEDQQRRLDQYQQPKWLWLWAAAGSAILTIALGFTSGAWTTQWQAEKMAAEAAKAARVELVANACAAGFATGSDYAARLSALRQASVLQRNAMLQDEGWVTLAGMAEPLAAAAPLCAERISNTPSADTNAMTTIEGSSG